MDPLTFAKNHSKPDSESRLDRWAENFLESTASETLRAARFICLSDAKMVGEYLDVLDNVLKALPEDSKLEVSRDLLDLLVSLPKDDKARKTLIESRVYAPSYA